MGKFIIKNAVALSFTIHAWGNRKQANMDKIETAADKEMLSLTKKLIDSDEYLAVLYHLNKTKAWLQDRSMPLLNHNSVMLFKIDMVKEVEEFLAERREGMKPIVQELVTTMPTKIEEAKSRLKEEQFDRGDYPTDEQLRNSFSFEYHWVSYGVPTELPEDVFEKEKEKAERLWAEAAESVTMGLREIFRETVAHLEDKLTEEPGKKKVLKDRAFEKIAEFIETFKSRNLTNDTELAKLVKSAESLLNDTFYGMVDLRKDINAREDVKQGLVKIKASLDKMIVNKPGRKFSFKE